MFMGGIVDLRRFSNTHLTSDNRSSCTTVGPKCQANMINKMPCTGDYGVTLYHNTIARLGRIHTSHKMLKTNDCKLIDAFGNTITLNKLSISCILVVEE